MRSIRYGRRWKRANGGLAPQLITISGALHCWGFRGYCGAAHGRGNGDGMLRGAGAAALMVGAWVLIAELPRAIAGGDPVWWYGLLATFWYSLGTIPAQLIVALLLAVLLFQEIRGTAIFRVLYFLPYIAPFVGTAAVFKIIFSSRPSAPINA